MGKVHTALVIGSGGREHALAARIASSPGVRQVVLAPGNAGTANAGKLRNAGGDPLAIAGDLKPDLVVVGPEAPLCDGLADSLRARGHVVYGPSKAAARLEASKAFMKDFAARHGIRTARHRVVTHPGMLPEAVAEFATPPVVKADGLCAGKGVVVAESYEEARDAARSMLEGSAFGDAGRTVVLEERLDGEEASVHAVCDGQRAFSLPVAQDHKRIGEGDTGPNTGGMGTYAPAPLVAGALAEEVERDIVQRSVAGMAADGAPFVGTLFAGLMIRREQGTLVPYLLEINVRFGDPETQVLMSLVDGDFAGLLHSAAVGALDPTLVGVARRHALCVVLAAAGYPAAPRKGDVISGLDRAASREHVAVYHAGTSIADDRVVVSGGRVLGVVGVDGDLESARRRAYDAIADIQFDGMQYRRDIGHRVLGAP